MRIKLPLIEFMPALALTVLNISLVLLLGKWIGIVAFGFVGTQAYLTYCVIRHGVYNSRPIIIQRRKK